MSLFSNSHNFTLPVNQNGNQNITEVFRLDSKGCAAILINSHDGKKIANQFMTYFKKELLSNNFLELEEPSDVIKYLEKMVEAFEELCLSKSKEIVDEREQISKEIHNLPCQEGSKFEELMKEIENIEIKLKCGCTFCAIIYFNSEYYLVNLGDNHLIMISEDNSISNLLEEHNFHNDAEIKRIVEDCCIDSCALVNIYRTSYSKYHSRCLGHYQMKKEFQEMDNYKNAKLSPLSSKPQIIHEQSSNSTISSITSTNQKNWTDILLISSGMYYLVMDLIYDKDRVLGEISELYITKNKDKLEVDGEPQIQCVLENIIRDYAEKHQNAFQQNSYKTPYERQELTILAIKPAQTNVSTGTEQTSLNSEESSSAKKGQVSGPYVNFDKWNTVESKMTNDEFDMIYNLLNVNSTSNKTEPIIEED